MNPQSQKVANRFSIRKYKTGAACVAIAALFLTSPAVMSSANAAEVDTDDTATEVVKPEAETEVAEDVTEEVLVEEPVEENVVETPVEDVVVEDEAPVVEEEVIPAEEPIEAEVVIPETESELAETVVPVEEPAETETIVPVEEPAEAEVTIPETESEPAETVAPAEESVIPAEEPVAETPETETEGEVVDVPVESVDEVIVEDETPVTSEEVVVEDETEAEDAPVEKDESSEVEVPETEEDIVDTPEESEESVDTGIVEDKTPVASEEETVEDETEAEDTIEEDNASEDDAESKDEVEASDAEAESDASEENVKFEEDKAEEIEADKRVSEAEIVEAIHWGDITDVPEVDTYVPKKYSDLYGDDINNDDYVINVDSIDYYKALIDYDALTGAQSFYNELLSQGRANAGVGAVQAKEHVQDFAFMKAVDMVMNRYFGSAKDGIGKTEYQETFFFGDDLPFNQDFERHTLNAARTSVDFGNDYKAAAEWFYDYMYANNKSHQETMNNADVTHTGLGIFRSYDGFTYVAQVLYKDGERNTGELVQGDEDFVRVGQDNVRDYIDTSDFESTSDWQLSHLNAINDERAKQGLSPLKLSTHLSQHAYMKALDMSLNNYFAHPKEGVGEPRDQYHYFMQDDALDIGGHWFGENIYWGSGNDTITYDDMQNFAYDGFFKSPAHYTNMTNENYTHIGLGLYQNPETLGYEFVQIFYNDATGVVDAYDRDGNKIEDEENVTPVDPELPSEPEIPVTPEVPEEDNTETPSEPETPSDEDVEETVTPAPSEDDSKEDTVKPVEPKPSDNNKEDDEETAVTVPSKPSNDTKPSVPTKPVVSDKKPVSKPSNNTSTDKAPVVELGPSKPVVTDNDTLPTSNPVIKVPVSTDNTEVGQTIDLPTVPVSGTLLDTNGKEVAIDNGVVSNVEKIAKDGTIVEAVITTPDGVSYIVKDGIITDTIETAIPVVDGGLGQVADTNELDIALTASDDAQSEEASVVAESTELVTELDDAHVDAKGQQVDVVDMNPSEEAQANADTESEQAVESDNPSESSVTSLPDTGIALGASSAVLGSILALFGGSALIATRRRKDDK